MDRKYLCEAYRQAAWDIKQIKMVKVNKQNLFVSSTKYYKTTRLKININDFVVARA